MLRLFADSERQQIKEMQIITTCSIIYQPRNGNAHSEYLYYLRCRGTVAMLLTSSRARDARRRGTVNCLASGTVKAGHKKACM